MGAHFQALIEGGLMAPLDSKLCLEDTEILYFPSQKTRFRQIFISRAPQLQITFHGSGDGRKASQN